MNMDGQKQTYEQFKADIFQWKDTQGGIPPLCENDGGR